MGRRTRTPKRKLTIGRRKPVRALNLARRLAELRVLRDLVQTAEAANLRA
jgi:hypothetical protein